MSPEFTPPVADKPFNTPESLQECFDLYQKISSQIMEWYGNAISNHPVIRLHTMAGIINQDCAVDGNGDPLLSEVIRLSADREERRSQQTYRDRMRLIAPYANNTAIDAAPLQNKRAEEFFTQLESIVPKEVETYEEFEGAFKKLTRILKVREDLAQKIDYAEYNNETTELVKAIAYRLVRDANQTNTV